MRHLKYKYGQTVYYPIDRYYTENGIEHLQFNVCRYEWNETTLNCTDPKFLCDSEEDCKKLCDLLNLINGY